MAKIKRFEDIKAWQLARELVKQVYNLTSSGKFQRDFGLKDQIRCAAVSVMSNISSLLKNSNVYYLYPTCFLV